MATRTIFAIIQLVCTAGILVVGGMGRAVVGDGGAERAAALFVFGDSYADSGNHKNGSDASEQEYKPWRLPYGITWPGFPTGRYSDGRVFTPFYANYLNVSDPIPYKRFIEAAANGTIPKTGINFAFGGSGVFPTASFCPNVSTQIAQLRDTIDDGLVSKDIINISIALLTVNGNDYTQYKKDGKNVSEISSFIQAVVEQIGSDIMSLYDLGFKKLAISNMAPVGCFPTITESVNYSSCVSTSNVLPVLHNLGLESKIEALQRQLPDAEFVILDFYNAFNKTLLGGTSTITESKLRPCCEGIGDADCGAVDTNGTALYTVCESPRQSLFWDDFHPSDGGWRNISAALFGIPPMQ